MNDLWPHQKHVSHLLEHGKNVILQAPTGSGKTRAALDHFLFQMHTPLHQATFPRRCIYSVPMRVLAKQFYREYERIIKRYNQKFGLSHQPIVVKTQTGEQPQDPELAANLIFATIDQTLSSYLLSPYSLGRNRANINAGAVMSSYLVFDEFHLYDPASTLPTTLLMLKKLKGITPFVLMTATFSRVMLEELGMLLNAEVFPSTQAERDQLDALASQRKERVYRVADEPLSAHKVLQAHERRSLVICNTVDRARYMFDALITSGPTDTEVILLHSRFLSDERNAIEERIRELFGKDADRETGSAIVVATQAIEVGVDMSSAALHTELAPANAIIQRAGRCARYAGESGTVYLYWQTVNPDDSNVPLDLRNPDNAAPYKSQKNLFATTLNAFRVREGRFSFADEQSVITEVHNAQDAQILKTIRESGRDFETSIFAVQRGEADSRQLVRDIQQQRVIIHANPDVLLGVRDFSPLELPAFQLHPGTLRKYVQYWLEAGATLEWSVKFLHDYDSENETKKPKPKDLEYAAQNNEERYRWHPVSQAKDELFAPLVVVHPALATYDLVRGFVPDQGGDWQTPIPAAKDRTTPKKIYTYRLETYQTHIQHVYQAFIEHWWESEWAAKHLETKYGWEKGSVRRAAELAVLLHDVGKLSQAWQKWVREYQQKVAALEDDITLETQTGQAYAHTHRQNNLHAEVEHKMGKRPWHAVEGAVSVAPVIAGVLKSQALLCAVFAAIARHHSPYSDSHQDYKLIPNAARHIAAVFPQDVPIPDLSGLTTSKKGKMANDLIPNPDGNSDAFLAYMLLARALRRADARGTERGNQL